ncbi:MAG: outer membrane beta-barrel protein [Tunicatimonas sp.]
MKHFLPLFGLLLAAQLTLAQQTTWSVNVTPTISYRIAKLSPADESVRNGERPSHLFDFGLQLRTRLGERIYLGTGLLYAQRGFSNRYVTAPYQRSLSRRYMIDFIQDYLDIPFFLTYNIVQNDQFQWYALGGINNGLLLRERNEVSERSYEQTVQEVPADVLELLEDPYLGASRQHNLGAIAGFGVRARVDAKTFVGLEAISKVMLTPLQDYASGTQRRPYTMGLNFRFVRTLWE